LNEQDSHRSQADLIQLPQEKNDHTNNSKDVHKNQQHGKSRKLKRLASSQSNDDAVSGNDDDELLSLRQQQQVYQLRIETLEKQVRDV